MEWMEWKKYSDMLFHNKKGLFATWWLAIKKIFSDIINIIVCK